MKQDLSVNVKDSIGVKILKITFMFYFILTLMTTFAHMAAEYDHVKSQIVEDIVLISHGFEPGLAKALWEYHLAQVETMVFGMVKTSSVTGVKVTDQKGIDIIKIGDVTDSQGKYYSVDKTGNQTPIEDLGILSKINEYKFPIRYISPKRNLTVGYIIIYSSSDVVFQTVKVGFVFIVVNAIIKTIALWFIFLVVLRRFLSRPLTILTKVAHQIYLNSFKNLQVDIEALERNELGLLQKVFYAMVVELQNRDRKVIERAAQLEESNVQLKKEISEHKRAKDILNKYEYIVSTTSDLISFVDANYIYRAVNNAYLKAHDKRQEDILGYSIAGLHGHEIFEDKIKNHFEVCISGKQIRYQSWFKYEGFGDRYMEVTYYPYFDDETVTGVVVNARDITEIKQAEEDRIRFEKRLHHKQKMEAIGTLAGGIAHDFNNILQGIFLSIELTERMLKDNESAKCNLQTALRLGERGRDLVRQILAFSRLEEQKHESINVTPIIEENLKMMRATLPTTIEIREDLKSAAWILGNHSQIHQVILNLCTNAGYAMRETGGVLQVTLIEVKISAKDADDLGLKEKVYLKISVSDTGGGIPFDIKDRIFEPFFSTKPLGEGSGMGLAVVHGIVQNHEGIVTEDNKTGQGATFNVYLPTIDRQFEKEHTEELIPSKGKGQILFVEDEEDILNLGESILIQQGYYVTVAKDGVEALKKFHADPNQFDIIVTDQTMPGKTGLQISEEIRSIRPDIQILLTTGYSEAITPEKTTKAGIQEIIMKPYSISELCHIIQDMLARA